MKEQQELQTRLKKLRREANEVKIASLQDEMVGLQEEMARKAKVAEKELQMARVSSSSGSSFRSISPVGTPDDNLTKVSGWMDKTEDAESVTSSINVPPGYQQTSISAPVITVRSTHSWRTKLRASEGFEVLFETGHVHRGRCARYWKGQNKDCHRWWQSKSNSTTRSEIRLIEAVDDSQCRPELVTTYVWRHPEWCISSTKACDYTEAVFAKSRAKHGVERKR